LGLVDELDSEPFCRNRRSGRNRTRRNIDAALKVKIALGAEIERLHAKAGQLLQRDFLEVRDGLTKDSMNS
jgi:hypothetical protein